MKALRRQARLAKTLDEQNDFQAKIRNLETKQRRQRKQDLRDRGRDRQNRNELIAGLQKRMSQKTTTIPLFTIRWRVIETNSMDSPGLILGKVFICDSKGQRWCEPYFLATPKSFRPKTTFLHFAVIVPPASLPSTPWSAGICGLVDDHRTFDLGYRKAAAFALVSQNQAALDHFEHRRGMPVSLGSGSPYDLLHSWCGKDRTQNWLPQVHSASLRTKRPSTP